MKKELMDLICDELNTKNIEFIICFVDGKKFGFTYNRKTRLIEIFLGENIIKNKRISSYITKKFL